MRLVRTGAETGGELLEMEVRYPAASPMPPEHHHPSQTETFTVLEGTMRVIAGGEERTYAAGERFDVRPGTRHRMAPQDGPARIRWEVRPALRTAEFFAALYGPVMKGEMPFDELTREFASEIVF